MMAPSVMLKSAFRPGKSYFANAYPAIAASRVAPNAATTA